MDRQGTINDINNLYEDSYKDLYLEMCQHYKYERDCNEKLLNENADLWKAFTELSIMYNQINDEYIEKMNRLIKKKMQRMNHIVSKYKK